MIYNAMSVADYMINRCYELKKPISNLQLQKMLYFLWVEYYRETGNSLFLDSIYAWQFGPVVPNVYYEYCVYGGIPIDIRCETEISKEDEKILNPIIDDYVDVPVSVLVNRTHQRNSAWDLVYQNGAGDRNVIPFDLIKQTECGGTYVSGRNKAKTRTTV